MLTNIGKNIIGKYLVGTSTQYASHIAIGCGSKPITTATSYSDYTTKTEMDFEMIRMPIISRSYLNDKTTLSITNVAVTNATNSATFTVSSNSFVIGQLVTISGISGATIGGVTATSFNQSYTVTAITTTTFTAIPYTAIAPTSSATSARTGTAIGYVNKISFTAELPLEDRYEITELALWSDLNNPIPSGIDSKNIFNFSRNQESWQYYLSSSGNVYNLTYVSSSLDTGATVVNSNTNNIVFATSPAIKALLTNSDNVFFNNATLDGNSKTRLTRYERPRFLDDAIILAADMSKFNINSGTTVPNDLDTTVNNDYLSISGIKFGNLDTNSTSDEFILAYSLINKNAVPTTSFATIESVNFMIEFLTNTGKFARYHFKQRSTSLSETNRYQTIKVSLGDSTNSQKDSLFKWSDATSAKIYASIQDSSGNQLTDYALALDGLNFNNKNNLNNANYGMVAYVPVKNTSAEALIKTSNSSNLIEFRLILGGINS